jgi:hypothetical protein
VPNVSGTYNSTVWLTQFNRTRDGYAGSWNCSGSMTLSQEPGSDKFKGFAVVGAPCPAVSFDLGRIRHARRRRDHRDPRAAARRGHVPPAASLDVHRALPEQPALARTQVKVQCPGELEGEYTFNQIITARKF